MGRGQNALGNPFRKWHHTAGGLLAHLLAETVNWRLEQGSLGNDHLPVVYGETCIAYSIGTPPTVNRPYRSLRIAEGTAAVNAGKLLYHFDS